MLFQDPQTELVTKTAWIAGVKLSNEESFHTQIVLTLARKQRLWDLWSKQSKPTYYYFLEIQLPIQTPPDFVPF